MKKLVCMLLCLLMLGGTLCACGKDETGTKTYTCAHNSEHTKTEDIAALGHEYDHDCDSDCNVCADTRTPAEHVDANKDHVCDVCSAELPKDAFPVGAIVGIAIGAVAVIGLGGFALFWFVIRKKRSAAV